jgi:uncharacterized membrane protein
VIRRDLKESGVQNPEKPTASRLLRRYFLTGVVAAVPLVVTFWFVRAVVRWVDALVAPILPKAAQALPGIGLLLALLGLILLGLVTANVAGRYLLSLMDRLLNRIPVVGNIYKPVRQMFETFRPGARSFRSVVLIDYPHPGTKSLAFITADAPAEIGAGKVAVFVPTSPNLYAGFLLYVEESKLTPLQMSVEDAIRLQVSAGMAGAIPAD